MTAPRTPRLPGAGLLALAQSCVADPALLAALQETLADLQAEWLSAPDRIARMRIRVRGYVAYWLVVLNVFMTRHTWPDRRPRLLLRFSSWRLEMTATSRVALVGTLLIAGLAAGYTWSRVRTAQFRSTAVIRIVPPRIPTAIGEGNQATRPERLEERLMLISQMVLSRTRLEGVIREFNLYERERQSQHLMEDAVMLMRRHIVLTNSGPLTFTLSYSNPDPMAAMKVTEKLAAAFINQGMIDRERTAEATLTFLDSRIDATRRELAELTERVERTSSRDSQAIPLRLELEVLQSTYKTLLLRRADAQAQIAIEQRRIGEEFVLLDAPQAAGQPMGPTRLQMMLAGGVAGLALAGLLGLSMRLRTLLQRRRALAAANT